jgi:hypothetical protein
MKQSINQSINRLFVGLRVGLFFRCNPGRRPVAGEQPQQWLFVGLRVGLNWKHLPEVSPESTCLNSHLTWKYLLQTILNSYLYMIPSSSGYPELSTNSLLVQTTNTIHNPQPTKSITNPTHNVSEAPCSIPGMITD